MNDALRRQLEHDRRMAAFAEFLQGRLAVTHGGIVGQVWRGGTGGQALLSRHLAGVDVLPLDDGVGRRAGVLPARDGDVVRARLTPLLGG